MGTIQKRRTALCGYMTQMSPERSTNRTFADVPSKITKGAWFTRNLREVGIMRVISRNVTLLKRNLEYTRISRKSPT